MSNNISMKSVSCSSVLSEFTRDEFLEMCDMVFEGIPETDTVESCLVPNGAESHIVVSGEKFDYFVSWKFRLASGERVIVHWHSPAKFGSGLKETSNSKTHYTCRIQIGREFLIKDASGSLRMELLTKRSSDDDWNGSHIIVSPIFGVDH